MNEQLEYKGYMIDVENLTYTIKEKLSTGKWKIRRRTNCNKDTRKYDRHGNRLYTAFETNEDAIKKAKSYIDNHIIPWEQKISNA